MQKHRFLSSLVVTVALLAPGLGLTLATAQERVAIKAGPVSVRVYDRAHKDYHVWDASEDQNYRQYLNDNHRAYRPIAKLSNKQQTTYWNTRHKDEKR